MAFPVLFAAARQALSPEAQAVIAAMTVAPNAGRQAAIDTLCRSLVAAGVWSRLGVLYVLAAHNAQAARLNWKAPTGTALSEVNGPAFTADRGYVGDGATAYLDSGIAWSAAPGVQQDDAHVGAYADFGGASPGGIAGQLSGNTISIGRSGTTYISRLHNTTTTAADTAAGTGGVHLCSVRTNAAAYERYINAVAGTQGVVASAAAGSANVTGLRNGGSFSGPTSALLALHGGASLTPQQVSSLRAALLAYMTSVGVS